MKEGMRNHPQSEIVSKQSACWIEKIVYRGAKIDEGGFTAVDKELQCVEMDAELTPCRSSRITGCIMAPIRRKMLLSK